MADNTSHTDEDGADDRAPPPGIEVIGEFPPGTPWWDAERLGFLTERGVKVFILMFAVAVTLMLIFETGLQTEGDDVFGKRLGIAYVGYMALMIALWVLLLAFRIAVVISGDRLERRAPPLGGMSIPRSFDLSKGVNPREHQYFSSGEWVCNGVQFNLTPGDEFEPPFVLSALFLGVDPKVLTPLLTYRIAKAKGENPPPPEFS